MVGRLRVSFEGTIIGGPHLRLKPPNQRSWEINRLSDRRLSRVQGELRQDSLCEQLPTGQQIRVEDEYHDSNAENDDELTEQFRRTIR